MSMYNVHAVPEDARKGGWTETHDSHGKMMGEGGDNVLLVGIQTFTASRCQDSYIPTNSLPHAGMD